VLTANFYIYYKRRKLFVKKKIRKSFDFFVIFPIVRAQKLFRDFSVLKKQFFVRFKAEKSRFCGGYLQKPIDRGGGVV